jgi:CheY-like chemotaxis protein
VDLVTKPFEREDLLRVLWRNLVRKRGGRVLIVDDEADMRTMLTEYLAGVGLESVTASDGKDGLEKVRTESPDAVILDLMMPVMGGLTFLKKLRKDPLHTGLPVFVLTGKAISEDESVLLDELASAVLFKEDAPEQLSELLGSIFSLVDAEG